MHPLVIHFPIVLLMIAPAFLLIPMLWWARWSEPFALIALGILLVGTLSLYAAVSTGEEAGELADRSGGVNGVLVMHEHLAEQSRIVFSGLVILLAVLVLVPKILKRPVRRLVFVSAGLAFLALYGGGLAVLVNTAHAGGRLVHEFGVHAMIPSSASPPTTSRGAGEGD